MATASQQIRTYCAMCTSRCGVIATVEDGKFTQVIADHQHPNGCICVKGTAAPEIVYSKDRLRSPMVRTRAKGDGNPGWVEITWEQALNLAALRLNDIKENFGPEAVVFSRATTAGSAAIDFDGSIQRLANAFGTPNFLTSNHICTWNRRVGSKYTYGTGMPTPDFDHAKCMLLWGVNPLATSPAQARRIARARSRGAKLIVIDPRKNTLAEKADCWLRVKPGRDGELAMAMIHVLIEQNLFDAEFVRRWTNGPFLVRCADGQLLTGHDFPNGENPNDYIIWDEQTNRPIAAGHSDSRPAISGNFNVEIGNGQIIECRPAFDLLKAAAAGFAPERSAAITTVDPGEVRKAVGLFAQEKPSCYCTWVGLEQDNDAMQTNRAVCIFYALTGQFDQRGSNVLFGTPPTNSVTGRDLLPKSQADLRLGLKAHPLGPPAENGLVQAAEVYEAILTGRPYPVKAMVLFGSDPLLGHGEPLRGKAALAALEFYVHVDLFPNPSAELADLLLPAASCWEREALMPSFDIAENTVDWVQLRPAVVPPVHQSKPDVEIIFALATKLGLGEHFFGGDIDASLNYQLAPSGWTAEALRGNAGGVRAKSETRYQKYAELNPANVKPRGFDTPSRKIEIFSTTFANAGYRPLPEFRTVDENDPQYPLTLTFFRDMHFCDEQHRNIPRLRRARPEPFLEIHPATAQQKAIVDGEWIWLETRTGKVKLKAKFSESLHPQVVTTVYGWWQPCEELKLPGYDPFHEDGANTNLLIPNSDSDPISASVAHRGQRCCVSK